MSADRVLSSCRHIETAEERACVVAVDSLHNFVSLDLCSAVDFVLDIHLIATSSTSSSKQELNHMIISMREPSSVNWATDHRYIGLAI